MEEHSDLFVTHENTAEVLHACSKYKVEAKSHGKSAREALAVTQAFLHEHLLTASMETAN